jgi:hypothetical protein
VKEAQDNIDTYRSHLFNEDGIKAVISKDEKKGKTLAEKTTDPLSTTLVIYPIGGDQLLLSFLH